MRNMVNVAGIEGVNGRGKDYFESSSLQNENNNEEYSEYGGLFCGGLVVTEDIKRQLESQPNSKFLYFEKTDDDKYLINPKLPEKGAVNTVEYNYELNDDGSIKSFDISESKTINFSIRKNINYLYKAIANAFIDENDNIDVQKGLKTVIDFGLSVGVDYHTPKEAEKSNAARIDIVKYNEAFKRIANYVSESTNMPEEDKEDFMNFCKAGVMGSGLSFTEERAEFNMVNGRFWDDMEQYLSNTIVSAINVKNNNIYNGKEYDEFKEGQAKSIEKFEDDIRYFSKIDPNNEKKFMNMFQATYVPAFFDIANHLSNNITTEKAPRVTCADVGKSYIPDNTTESGKSVVPNFTSHNVVALDFKINDKDCIITIDADSRDRYEQSKDFGANNQTYIGIHQVGQSEPRKYKESDYKDEIEEINYKVRRKMSLFLGEGKEIDQAEFEKRVIEEKGKLKKRQEEKFEKEKKFENLKKFFKKAPNKLVETDSLNAYKGIDSEMNHIQKDVCYKLGMTEIKNSDLQKKRGLEVLDSFLGCKRRDINDYVQDLGKLYINGAKATTVFDLDDIANIQRDEVEARVHVAAAKLKEMFDNNLDSLHFNKMHFALENAKGKLEPIYAVNEIQEVKEAEKPGKTFKMFHSKALYEEKMAEWKNYQGYLNQKENLKRVNEETKLFYNELNEIRQKEKKVSENNNVRKTNLADLTGKKNNSAEKVTKPVSKENTNELNKQADPIKMK